VARPAGRSFGGVVGACLLAFVAAFAAGGCDLVMGAAGLGGGVGGIGNVTGPNDGGGVTGPFESFGPDGPPGPSPLATYSKGRAALALSDGSTVVLERLSPGPHLYTEFGSNVRWSNADGWYLTVAGASAADGAFGAAYLQLDRIQDHAHWTSDDPSRCHVVIQAANPGGLRGTAACSGLRWIDNLGGNGFGAPLSPLPGQLPFDAQISFEATP
jgi:hypothetical protein